MSILISLIVYLIVLGLIWYLVGMLPLPAPIRQIVNVLFIIVAIVAVLSLFGIVNVGLPAIKL